MERRELILPRSPNLEAQSRREFLSHGLTLATAVAMTGVAVQIKKFLNPVTQAALPAWDIQETDISVIKNN